MRYETAMQELGFDINTELDLTEFESAIEKISPGDIDQSKLTRMFDEFSVNEKSKKPQLTKKAADLASKLRKAFKQKLAQNPLKEKGQAQSASLGSDLADSSNSNIQKRMQSLSPRGR
jgi:hypothetical protein